MRRRLLLYSKYTLQMREERARQDLYHVRCIGRECKVSSCDVVWAVVVEVCIYQLFRYSQIYSYVVRGFITLLPATSSVRSGICCEPGIASDNLVEGNRPLPRAFGIDNIWCKGFAISRTKCSGI